MDGWDKVCWGGEAGGVHVAWLGVHRHVWCELARA
jgi:hypothetical protein